MPRWAPTAPVCRPAVLIKNETQAIPFNPFDPRTGFGAAQRSGLLVAVRDAGVVNEDGQWRDFRTLLEMLKRNDIAPRRRASEIAIIGIETLWHEIQPAFLKKFGAVLSRSVTLF